MFREAVVAAPVGCREFVPPGFAHGPPGGRLLAGTSACCRRPLGRGAAEAVAARGARGGRGDELVGRRRSCRRRRISGGGRAGRTTGGRRTPAGGGARRSSARAPTRRRAPAAGAAPAGRTAPPPAGADAGLLLRAGGPLCHGGGGAGVAGDGGGRTLRQGSKLLWTQPVGARQLWQLLPADDSNLLLEAARRAHPEGSRGDTRAGSARYAQPGRRWSRAMFSSDPQRSIVYDPAARPSAVLPALIVLDRPALRRRAPAAGLFCGPSPQPVAAAAVQPAIGDGDRPPGGAGGHGTAGAAGRVRKPLPVHVEEQGGSEEETRSRLVGLRDATALPGWDCLLVAAPPLLVFPLAVMGLAGPLESAAGAGRFGRGRDQQPEAAALPAGAAGSAPPR